MASAVFLALAVVLSLAHAARSALPGVGLIEKEFLFLPKDVTAGAGEITFIVKNRGMIEHNFVLEAPGGKTVAQISFIEPGEDRRFTASLPPGVYTIYCSLPGHREAGMGATLRVKSMDASTEILDSMDELASPRN